MVTRKFGTLLIPFRASFRGVSIEPFENHERISNSLTSIANKDGYFYPPTVQTYQVSSRTGKPRRIKNTARPASVYHLPATHSINIENPAAIDINFEDAGLFIHLLAFLFGTRLQFSEWRMEGRVPINSNHNISISEEVAAHFLESVYCEWREWPEESRKRFVNILYVYTRAKSLEWDWDAFMWQYTTFDALYKLYSELCGKTADSHPKRFNLVCDAFGIQYKKELINDICNARRLLVHEAMWVDTSIGHAVDNKQLKFHLARFNARLICALAGYRNEYTRSTWASMGAFIFDKAK
jgi:hypothetical protein